MIEKVDRFESHITVMHFIEISQKRSLSFKYNKTDGRTLEQNSVKLFETRYSRIWKPIPPILENVSSFYGQLVNLHRPSQRNSNLSF